MRLEECPPINDWKALLADPNCVVLTGSLDDSIVAYLVMHLSPSKDRGVISHVYVEVEGRELGLGDAMVEQAIAVARDADLGGIEAVALPGDRETKNMFERAGLTARKLTVYKSLRSTAVPERASLVEPAG